MEALARGAANVLGSTRAKDMVSDWYSGTKENVKIAADLIDKTKQIAGIINQAKDEISDIVSDPLWVHEGLLFKRAHDSCVFMASVTATRPQDLRTVVNECAQWSIRQYENTSSDPVDLLFKSRAAQIISQADAPSVQVDPTCLVMMNIMRQLSNTQLDKQTRSALGKLLCSAIQNMHTSNADEDQYVWLEFKDLVLKSISSQKITDAGRIKEYISQITAARAHPEAEHLDDYQFLKLLLQAIYPITSKAGKQQKALITRMEDVMVYGCAVDYYGIAKALSSKFSAGLEDGTGGHEKQLVQKLSDIVDSVNTLVVNPRRMEEDGKTTSAINLWARDAASDLIDGVFASVKEEQLMLQTVAYSTSVVATGLLVDYCKQLVRKTQLVSPAQAEAVLKMVRPGVLLGSVYLTRKGLFATHVLRDRQKLSTAVAPVLIHDAVVVSEADPPLATPELSDADPPLATPELSEEADAAVVSDVDNEDEFYDTSEHWKDDNT